ncbi:TPA: hypothetical protein ACGG7T_003820 [Vibrio cholerae]
MVAVVVFEFSCLRCQPLRRALAFLGGIDLVTRKFASRTKFKRWIKSVAAIAISISVLYGDYEKARIESSNSKILYATVTKADYSLPNGKYVVSFEPVDDIEQDSIDYSKLVMAMTFEILATSGQIIGTKVKLLNALNENGFKYTFYDNDTSSMVSELWVLEPQVPEEIELLKLILSEYAMGHAFNDGTGTINLNNFKFSNSAFEIA